MKETEYSPEELIEAMVANGYPHPDQCRPCCDWRKTLTEEQARIFIRKWRESKKSK